MDDSLPEEGSSSAATRWQRLQNYFRGHVQRIQRVNENNAAVFRKQPWLEIGGSFGDFGTFIPIYVALAERYSTSSFVSSTLVFSGLANILTGFFFGIPLPVQPMKALAATALGSDSSSFTSLHLMSAGIFVGFCVGLLSITSLLQRFTRAIPVPVVKGIQVGAGITLGMKAIPTLAASAGLQVFDQAMVYVFAAVLLLMSYSRRFPLALWTTVSLAALMLVGIAVDSLYRRELRFEIWHPYVTPPPLLSKDSIVAGLGQLPLTTLNSVVAVVYLAEDLFPSSDTPSATSVGISVALMNLVGCWFGAMPVCHGSGGLAAQYKFGARSGASIIFLGTIKLVLGLFAGNAAFAFCQAYPGPLLAVLLFLAGQELVRMGESINSEAARDLWEQVDGDEASESAVDDHQQGSSTGGHAVTGGGSTSATSPPPPARRQFRALTEEEKTRRWTVMSATVLGLLGAKNDGVGFLVGMFVHGSYNGYDWWNRRAHAGSTRREGQIRLPEDDEEAATAAA